MNVLLLNGSRRNSGCTFTALSEVAVALNEAGIETEIIQIGSEVMKGDIRDLVSEVHEKIKSADGLVVGSPVYFSSPSGEILMFLDRLFVAAEKDLRLKPGCAVASARRGGTTATLDVLNKYFTYAEMPVVSSRYWNIVHGNTPDEVKQDQEGLQIMRVLGRNMAWLMKCIEAGRTAGIALPEQAKKEFTNFIR